MDAKVISRRYDLDWMRILGILAVFTFHSVRFFNYADWHVKNVGQYQAAQLYTDVLDLWIMPLMFVLSGASLFLSLEKGKAGKFILDKVWRLFIPLLVGMFSHAALQVYLEHLTHGVFKGSFFEWLPNYFNGIYGLGGNFALLGMHLWYLAVLFVFSIMLLPLFMLLKTNLGSRILDKISAFFALPGMIYLVVLPLVLLNNLDPDSFLGFDKFNWTVGVYIFDLLIGYMIMSSERLQNRIIWLRWISLVGLVAFTAVDMITDTNEELAQLCWILTILGFGMKYLRFSNPFQKYAAEAVLPFYILHQTVLLVVGFFVLRVQMPDLLKWVVNSGISFAAILLIYEYGVRRWNVMRFLFGMKVKKQVKPLVQPVAKRLVEN